MEKQELAVACRETLRTSNRRIFMHRDNSMLSGSGRKVNEGLGSDSGH